MTRSRRRFANSAPAPDAGLGRRAGTLEARDRLAGTAVTVRPVAGHGAGDVPGWTAASGARGPRYALRRDLPVQPSPSERARSLRRPAPRATTPYGRLYTRARRAWDRPLTAYYLILGGSLLITVLGLVMVYSASQITALQMSLPGSYFFRKQFLAAVDRRRAAARRLPDAGEAAPGAGLPDPRGRRLPDGPGAGAGDREWRSTATRTGSRSAAPSRSSPASSASSPSCCGAPTCSPASRTRSC